MKSVISLTIIAINIIVGAAAFAAVEPPAEQKPITKVMLARLGWVQSLAKSIAYSDYEGIKKDADELSAQTRKAGETATAEFNKEKNLAISSAAANMIEIAGKKDVTAVSHKFGELLGTCASCHAKLRDNKQQ